MTDAEKAAMAMLDRWANSRGPMGPHVRTIKAMLAEPRLPGMLPIDMADRMQAEYEKAEGPARDVDYFFALLRAELTRPHVDFGALDEARMEPPACATEDERDMEIAKQRLAEIASDPDCLVRGRELHSRLDRMMLEQSELRAAISVLRGWSAEAAGRTGLQPAVRMVCNAAESTLPKTMVRIRGQLVNGENFDFLALLPVSQSEVPQ